MPPLLSSDDEASDADMLKLEDDVAECPSVPPPVSSRKDSAMDGVAISGSIGNHNISGDAAPLSIAAKQRMQQAGLSSGSGSSLGNQSQAQESRYQEFHVYDSVLGVESLLRSVARPSYFTVVDSKHKRFLAWFREYYEDFDFDGKHARPMKVVSGCAGF